MGQASLTVLFGESGLGKTSLVQAGLFPRLRQQNILPVYVRLDMRDRSAPLIDQTGAALQAEIARHGVDAPAPKPGESPWEHLHGRKVAWWSAKNQPLTPLFVFDQFEEAFTLGAENTEAIERLRLDLADLIENRIPEDLARRIEAGALAEELDLQGQRYRVLLSFREDFLPEVEGWKGELPSLLRNRLRLLPMSADRAFQVVSGETAARQRHELVSDETPARRTHELVSGETAREIVRFVAAVQTGDDKFGRGKRLRTVSDLSWDKLEIEPALLSLLCEGLNEKRKARAVATIDAALLKETGEAIIGDFYRSCVADVPEKTRRFIEDALITEGGFRNSYPLEDALDQGLLTEPLLRQLVDRRLLRIDHQLGADRVEIIHDRLTEVVREHRDRERERIRIRRQRRMWWAAGSVAVVLGAVGALFFVLWLNAQRAEAATKATLREAIAWKRVMQSRAILDGQRPAPTDIALLLAAAAYVLKPENEAYGGLQYALEATARLIKTVSFPDPIIGVSPDSRTVVMRDYGTLRLWDSETGEPRGAPLPGHADEVTSVAFSPDGKTLVSGSRDKTLRLWDAETGQPRGAPLPGHADEVTSVAFSPDGKTLVSGSRDNTLRRWDAATGRPIGEPLQGHTDEVTSVAFSPDGKTLVSSSRDKTVRLWDAETGEPRGAPLPGHADEVTSVAFSPDGKTLVSGSSAGRLRRWDAATGRPIGEPLQGHTDEVTSVAFSPNSEILVSGSSDGTLRLWDATTGQPRGVPLRGHTDKVTSVVFSTDGKTLVSGSADDTVRLWEAAAGLPREAPLPGHEDQVTSVAFSPDGKTLVSGSLDRTLRLWDAATGELRWVSLQEHRLDVTSVAFSPDGKMLVSGSGDGTLRLWVTAKGQPRGGPIVGHTDRVRSVAFSPHGKTLVSGSYDKSLRLWDAETGKPRGVSLQGHTDRVESVAFSPDGKTLVSGSYDKSLRLWDAETGKPRGVSLQGHTDWVESVAFSHDGKTLVSGSRDRTLRLWDAATGQPRGAPLQGHTAGVNSVAFSHDGKTVVSGSRDKTLRVWDAETGEPRGAPLQGHTDSVWSVAFSPDGKILVSGSGDKTLRLWDAPAVWIDRICAKLVRNLSRAGWKHYVGDIPYIEQCPGLPVPGD